MTFREDDQSSDEDDQKKKKFQSVESVKSYQILPQEANSPEKLSCWNRFNSLKGFFFAFLTAVSRPKIIKKLENT